MLRFSKGLAIFFISALSFVTCVNAQTEEVTSTTTVNPITQESTTTTVNPNTQQTTITKTDPSTNITTTTIINTPVPAPQEVVAAPQGYANCFKVAAGWYKGVWVPEHNVCQYDNSQTTHEGVAWIEGHWTCTQYKASEGACTKWEWKSGRWVKTFEVY